jgi:hypothetical protein
MSLRIPVGEVSSPRTRTPSAVTTTDTLSSAVSSLTLCPGTRYMFCTLRIALPAPNGTDTCVIDSSSAGLLAL